MIPFYQGKKQNTPPADSYLLVANMDVSRIKMCVHTSMLATIHMNMREYVFTD
jgi:hypothetical protein